MKEQMWFVLMLYVLCVQQLVSPGAWLSDLCQERYEVREKKTSKKVLISFSLLYDSCYIPVDCLFSPRCPN